MSVTIHQISVLAPGFLAFAMLVSITSLAYADSVQVIMAKGTAAKQDCGDQCYVPHTVSIAVGNTVGWKNSDSVAHTATATDGSFDTSLVNAGASASNTFNSAGTYPYMCVLHPWMKGTVIVGNPSVPLTPTTPIDTSIKFVIDADPRISVNIDKDKYLAGDIVTISGNGFPNAQSATILILDSAQNKISDLTFSSTTAGTFQTIWTVPSNMKSGQYVIQVSPPIYPPPSEEILSPPRVIIRGQVESPNNIIDITLRIGVLVDGNIDSFVRIMQVKPLKDGSFEASFVPDPNLAKTDDYKVIANYVNLKSEVIFTYDGTSSEILVQLPTLGSTPDEQESPPDEEPPQTDLSYSADVSMPAGSSTQGCEDTNRCYIPADISIAVGGEVVWSNDDSASHTVTSGYPTDGPDGNFDSGLFLSGQTFAHIFDQEGKYPYFCLVHPWMTGIVYVGQGIPDPTPVPTPTLIPTSTIELAVNLKKSEYDLGEMVPLFIAISGVSSPQNVAITVTDPFGTVMVSRTLTTDSRSNAVTDFKIAESFKTGTYRVDATSSINGITYSANSEFRVTSQFNQIQIISAQGTDQQGNPMEFSRGNMGFVKVQVSAQKPIATLITVNVFDADLTPLGVGSLKTTLNTGQSELILSFMIPEDAVIGNVDIYVNALSDWVSAGGIPQTGEFAGQVRIN